jgi:hypothetical protein
MTTHIFNALNQCIGEGRNLRILFEKARKFGGVSRITVDQLSDSRHYEALVNVHFSNGYRGCTNFASYSHACEWAAGRSALSPRVSYWAGAAVTCNPLKGVTP